MPKVFCIFFHVSRQSPQFEKSSVHVIFGGGGRGCLQRFGDVPNFYCFLDFKASLNYPYQSQNCEKDHQIQTVRVNKIHQTVDTLHLPISKNIINET